ncbi:MAG: hypothetical protein IJJ22_00825 [Oscillospiraceae bacterium]|nr:hypothetical protein [Oscillospiraceae bacterium]
MNRLFQKFKNMKREGLFLYFVIGIYLLYTARSILESLSENPGNRLLFIIFAVIFLLFGLFLVAMSGYHLLRNYYLNLYLAALEEEQARLEAAGNSDDPPPEKKKTGTDKYLDFMYRLFKIKQ